MAVGSASHTKTWKILKTAVDQWLVHRSARLGAALAYYSVFSMGPLLLIVISIAGLFFGADAAVVREHLPRLRLPLCDRRC
jgi:membrane protein